MVLDSGANLAKKITHSGQDGPHILALSSFLTQTWAVICNVQNNSLDKIKYKFLLKFKFLNKTFNIN